MSQQPITIIGAGIAGLVLGRSLLRHGSKAIIYQRGSPGPRFAYGITLYPWAYQPLLKMLDMDFAAFRQRLAVDVERGGSGMVEPADARPHVAPFRASRQKFEEFLKEDLDIRYDHQVTAATHSSQGVTIEFETQDSLSSRFVVDASGIHSKIRYSLSKETDPSVLPYVVFNGKRRVKIADFEKIYAPFLKDTASIEQRRNDGIMLSVSIAECKDDLVNLSYTFSRRARNDDELHKPARALAGSEDIPDAFYTELRALESLEEPYASMFDADKVKSDRVLHWLMRTTNVRLPEVQRLAQQGVVMIGDASHGHPIVGGEGANAAISDGLQLGDWIASSGTSDLATFFDSRHADWSEGVRRSEKQLDAMHAPQTSRSTSSL